MKFIKKHFWLLTILSLAIFLRTYHAGSTPPGVYPDEAVNGMDALNAAQTGHFQWFYEANNGREGLFINIIAIFFKFFGVSILTLKLTSILFGVLAVWGIYFLAQEIFQDKRAGLVSAFLTAVSFWPLNFSRIAFRAIAVPALLVFSFYFLFRGLRTRKWLDFALGGFFFGLGLHTYIAFRVAPLILIVMLFVLLFTRKHFLGDFWKSLLVFLVFATLSAGPMFYTFFIAHPEYWQSRTSEISILNPNVNHGHLLSIFAKTFSLSFLKYNFWGDQNWRHNFPPYAILDPLTGIAFLFGFIYSLLRFFHLAILRITKKVRDTELEIHSFLLCWFFIMLIPEFMAAEGTPHALRSIGTLPTAFLFATLTFVFFFRKAKKHSLIFQKIVSSITIACLIFVGFFNTIKYHFVWAKNPQTAGSFDKNLMDISSYLKTLPSQTEKFVVAESMQRIPIELFNYDQPDISYVYSSQVNGINPKDKNKFTIILTDRNDSVIEALRIKFPKLELEEKKNSQGAIFYVLKIKS